MDEIKKALLNIKDSIKVLENYCKGTSCGDCILKHTVCASIVFESATEAIDAWLEEE